MALLRSSADGCAVVSPFWLSQALMYTFSCGRVSLALSGTRAGVGLLGRTVTVSLLRSPQSFHTEPSPPFLALCLHSPLSLPPVPPSYPAQTLGPAPGDLSHRIMITSPRPSSSEPCPFNDRPWGDSCCYPGCLFHPTEEGVGRLTAFSLQL